MRRINKTGRHLGLTGSALMGLALMSPVVETAAQTQEPLPQEVRDLLTLEFAQADLDQDGVLSKDELVANIRKDFQHSDIDGDGALTISDHPSDIDPENLLRAELEHDANGDKTVHWEEYRAGHLPMIEAMDANGDTTVTLDEVLDHHSSRFSQVTAGQ